MACAFLLVTFSSLGFCETIILSCFSSFLTTLSALAILYWSSSGLNPGPSSCLYPLPRGADPSHDFKCHLHADDSKFFSVVGRFFWFQDSCLSAFLISPIGCFTCILNLASHWALEFPLQTWPYSVSSILATDPPIHLVTRAEIWWSVLTPTSKKYLGSL